MYKQLTYVIPKNQRPEKGWINRVPFVSDDHNPMYLHIVYVVSQHTPRPCIFRLMT